MLKHLNGGELTSPKKCKGLYVPSKSTLKMPMFKALIFHWCSSLIL